MSTKTCVICGHSFEASRSDALCCSHPCRQKLYRLRKGGSVPGVSLTKDADGTEHITRTRRTRDEITSSTVALFTAAIRARRKVEEAKRLHTDNAGGAFKVTEEEAGLIRQALEELEQAARIVHDMAAHATVSDAKDNTGNPSAH